MKRDWTETDESYMRRCFVLAANGLGRVRPNPLVGCVVVRDGRILSEGFHQRYGENHAERNALLRVDPALVAGATLYVNLEPCSHQGKTPPCADLVIERGIRRVVCCNDDPNPLVAGGGFRKLEAAGIEVVRHVLDAEGRELNRRFFTFMERQRPYVILKWAESADGFMAPPSDREEPYWLSTQLQNRLNHRWRTEEAAILVGSGTYLADRPRLDARHYAGPQPQAVVLDRRGRVGDARTGVLVLRSQGVDEAMHALYERQVQSVIVEGGRQVLDAFIAAGCYDEVRVLRGAATLGGGLAAPEIPPVDASRLVIVSPSAIA